MNDVECERKGGSVTSALAVVSVAAGAATSVQIAEPEYSKEELLALRQQRREALASAEAAGAGGGGGAGAATAHKLAAPRPHPRSRYLWPTVTLAVIGGGALAWRLWHDDIAALYRRSPLHAAGRWVNAQLAEIARPFTEPSSDKLLPDWPPSELPPDTPCPPTLVLDLENTLVHMDWHRRTGWRVARRPGVEEFLREMSMYYEIVIFTSAHVGSAEPIVTSLDPAVSRARGVEVSSGYTSHRLYRDATLFSNGTHVKDLSKINRDMKHVIIIDDEPEAFQLQPDNGIRIKPYEIKPGEDPHADTALTDLIPFLRALAMEGVRDYRNVLRPFRGQDSDAVVAEYRRRVDAANAAQRERDNSGLGGLLRGAKRGHLVPDAQPTRRSAIPSSRDLVGAAPADASARPAGRSAAVPAVAVPDVKAPSTGVAPPPPEKQGSLLRWYRNHSQEIIEERSRKLEKWQETTAKKQKEASGSSQ
ncbi:NLI interacting factor-like phosphatase-domain-containing protein [Tribonema minus]|uniref:Mitochondrial import inner membrane translocase subunit TIM50 n=1 Tax=Tribonema minus TaxID=303371 RepID=A0A835YRZ2_9STRA|nr:NLI interacting factor-like phosphatase-domain-containing protein [Tribonema minus]